MIDGPIHRAAFEAAIETQLAPTPAKGDVVILDSLAVHKSEQAAACLKRRGAWFLFLPAYSPVSIQSSRPSQSSKAHLRKRCIRLKIRCYPIALATTPQSFGGRQEVWPVRDAAIS